MEHGVQAPINTTSQGDTAQMDVSHARSVGGSIVTMGAVNMLSVEDLVYMPGLCSQLMKSLEKETNNILLVRT